MYLTYRRLVTFDNVGTSTRLGNVPQLPKRHKYGIIGATQTRNQNGQVRDVPGYGSRYKTG